MYLYQIAQKQQYINYHKQNSYIFFVKSQYSIISELIKEEKNFQFYKIKIIVFPTKAIVTEEKLDQRR